MKKLSSTPGVEKFTPGPWTLETVATSVGSCHKIGPFPSLGARAKTYACVYADSVRIGIDDLGGVCKIGDELLANARLIAAAPDLLAACDAVEFAIRLCLTKELAQYQTAWAGLTAQVSAAARKARGA